MAVRRSNTDGIARCGMSRATPEATGCRHRATTRSVLPQRPPRQQANKQQSTNAPKNMAKWMTMAMRQYGTAHIAHGGGLGLCKMPLNTITGQVLRPIEGNETKKRWFFPSFFVVDPLKRGSR